MRRFQLPLLGSSRQAAPQRKRPVQLHRPLPLLGSNQDSPDPESGVLPVTPRGSFVSMELRGIEPLTSAVRLQRSPS